MRCNNCDTALGYNLIHQWWLGQQSDDAFEHPCPFCGATLYIHLHATIEFAVTTFLKTQYLPPKAE